MHYRPNILGYVSFSELYLRAHFRPDGDAFPEGSLSNITVIITRKLTHKISLKFYLFLTDQICGLMLISELVYFKFEGIDSLCLARKNNTNIWYSI